MGHSDRVGQNNLNFNNDENDLPFQKALNMVRLTSVAREGMSEWEALHLVKMKFLYDCVLQRAIDIYPQSTGLAFLKAHMALHCFKNKYLTLTTIA